MRYDNLHAFVKHLEGATPNHLASTYLVVGKNQYECGEAYKKLLKAVFHGRDPQSHDITTFSAESLKISDLLSELDTIGLFSSRRVVVIQQGEKLKTEVARGLEKYLLSSSPGVTFIIIAETILRTTNFYKKLEKEGVILDLPEEKAWQKEKKIQGWIREKVSEAGRRIDPNACTALTQKAGFDQSLLHQELEKLFCYLGERTEITLQDVKVICSAGHLESIWTLGESIFTFDASTAMRVAKSFLDDGVALLALLRQLRSQFETEFQICTLMMHSNGREEVMKQFPYMKGEILNKHLQQAQSYGMLKLKKGLLSIDKTESQMKNSVADAGCLLETLIAKLATK